MKRLPRPCVLDASAGIKMFLDEEHSEDVQRLFEEAREAREDSIYVPDLFFVECANVLWKKVRRAKYSESDAVGDLADLRALELPAMPTSQLVDRALELACLHGISVYDACYAVLADDLDLPLLTADLRLASILAAAGFQTATLGG